jgi:hypothetical protein
MNTGEVGKAFSNQKLGMRVYNILLIIMESE